MRKLILHNHLSPGDVLVMSGAIRCLHEQYPGEFQTDVRTPCNEIYNNCPYITPLEDGEVIEMAYPLIHESNQRPVHFLSGYVAQLGMTLGVPLHCTVNRPHLWLSEEELRRPPQVEGKYWLIVSGIKQDFTCKGWGVENYQKAVKLLKGKVRFVQVGKSEHNHKPLNGVVNLLDKTSTRELILAAWHAEGGLGPITFLQHIFAAFEKPYVALLGGRESLFWEHYPTQATMSTLGQLPCCRTGGCWKSRVVALNDGDDKDNSLCERPVNGIPQCMDMIQPSAVAQAVLRYYRGGVL